MCSYDHDPAEVWQLHARRAIKRHRCDECFVDILPGESYAQARWKADGDWGSSKRCALCYFLAEAIETLVCGDHGQILWGGQCIAEELNELGVHPDHLDIYEGNQEFAWAGQLFDAIRSRIFDDGPNP